MTVKSSISLTGPHHAFARALVEQGRYASVSAVVHQGLELLRQKTEAEDAETAALRALVADRRAGVFLTADQMQSRLAAMLDQKRRGHDLED